MKACSVVFAGVLGSLPFLVPIVSKADAGIASTTGNVATTSRPFPIERLSSGALMLLDQNGDLVQWPKSQPRKATADSSLAAGLDPRIGPNVRLGDDPPPLPTSLRAQAEPHIVRDPNNPDFLVATFQEGRYTNGGAVDCGYAVSHDGGLTWARALIQSLTTVVGGPYYRATDPVAAIDLRGNVFINTLGALDQNFVTSALLVSRSTNGGLSFQPPVELCRSPDTSTLIDKNWMAINSFPGTPTAGRIVSTFTRFDANGDPLALTYSDDDGQTWSPWKYITPIPFYAQGSQPVFLPDGKLAVIYWNFSLSDIEVIVSPDGGASFSYSNLVADVSGYDAPNVRDGNFLPSATGNRTDNTLYVTYQGYFLGQPRVLFTKSPDAGVTWTAPVPISDNDQSTPVFNPAISVSADGQQIAVAFYDGRVNPANAYLVDLFLAQSLDGGTTWQPNLRLTTVSSDVRLAPLTGTGYMLGDYLGVAPPVGRDVPAVPVLVDTRTGSPDPFIVRAGVSAQITFPSWRAARLSLAQISDPRIGSPSADPDGDGLPNALEYAFGLNPLAQDRPVFQAAFAGAPPAFLATYQRLRSASDLSFQWLGSTNLVDWTLAAGTAELVIPGNNPRFENVTANLGTNSPGAHLYRLGVTLTGP